MATKLNFRMEGFRKIVLATLHTNILIRRDLDATRKQTNPSHKTTLN
jgi:hypothetical protein